MTDDGRIARGTIDLGQDFLSHRIRGQVRHARGKGIDPNLDAPLVSYVYTDADSGGELWQGGSPDFGRMDLPEGFDFVLNLYVWGGYQVPESTEHRKVRMYDSLDQATDQVDELAEDLASRVKRGQKCFVHCQAGLNRSGLLAAVTLVKLGFAPADAIKLLRDSRSPLVLVNEAFENHVLSLAA